MKNDMTIQILDCTLRDGSYVIDYQFTVEDTYLICLGLARAGFPLIEIGHGLGIGSSQKRKGRAAATDLEYLQAACAALNEFDTQCGMFFIPGIGSMEELHAAAKAGMDFVRIGTNVNEIAKAESFIKQAKDLGLTVSSNLMKSYAVTIDEFKQYARMADGFGADVICVVDSAGGMLPEDVRKYIEALKSVTAKDIGFHGHNNLQMAIANTLTAVEAGARIVDSTLQGMGRSAGNAQTEVLVMVLEKLGYRTGVNPFEAMDIGRRIVRTMMHKEQGVDDMSLVSGIAQFHSGFTDLINEMSRKYHVDPRRLVVEVSKIDRVNVSRDLAEKTARLMAPAKTVAREPEIFINKNILIRRDADATGGRTQTLLKEVISLSRKTDKESVFSLTISRTGKDAIPFIRQSSSLVIANIEARDLKDVETMIDDLDGAVQWILLDESCAVLRESSVDKKIRASRRAWYSEERVLLLSLCAFLSQKSFKGRVLVCADETTAGVLLPLLKQQGFEGERVTAGDDVGKLVKKHSDVCALVSFGEEFSSFLGASVLEGFRKDALVCCARPGAFQKNFWEMVLKSGLLVCRVDARAALASELSLVIETNKQIQMMGQRSIDDIQIVSSGVIGKKGAVVVDSVHNPGKVIGICDGGGGLLSPQDETPFRGDMEKIRAWIIRGFYQ